MPRRRKGRPTHGWLIIDKPAGMTSSRVVEQVRRLGNVAKAGHAGTLDPMATGVLPIALGEATKTVGFAMDRTKVYRFTVRWGERRTTDDAEGGVLETSDNRPTRAAIEAVLPRFEGVILQRPPAFSAIKVDGRRAYELARAAALPEDTPELEPREVEIDSLRLVGLPDGDHAEIEAVCGKGTYMRALARDIAEALDTLGHVSALRRLRVGAFDESAAISLESVEELGHSPATFEHLLPIEAALDDIPALALNGTEATRLRNGQAVPLFKMGDASRLGDAREGDLVCAMAAGKPVAIACIDQGRVRPVRVLNL